VHKWWGLREKVDKNGIVVEIDGGKEGRWHNRIEYCGCIYAFMTGRQRQLEDISE
jgi:predicted adenine nucleotide alpha hydrolase (AANH) superfamily ATPase